GSRRRRRRRCRLSRRRRVATHAGRQRIEEDTDGTTERYRGEAERRSECQRFACTTSGKVLKRCTTRLLTRVGRQSGASAKCAVAARSWVRTACAPRRASGAPTQKWIPRPNAR